MVFRIKQYDNKTACRATLQAEGNPVDLTTVTEVRFIMRSKSEIVIDKAVYIADAEQGKVWFPFESSETAKTGAFKGEFTVTFSDDRKETFPNVGYLLFEIIPSLREVL